MYKKEKASSKIFYFFYKHNKNKDEKTIMFLPKIFFDKNFFVVIVQQKLNLLHLKNECKILDY